MLEYRDIYAGGRLVCSESPDVLTIINPATEEVVGAAALDRLAAALEARAEEAARLVTAEMGMP